MKKIITTLALGAAAFAGAGTAQADVSDYLGALHGMGFYNASTGDVGLLRTGYRICSELNAGYTAGEVANRLYLTTDYSVSRSDAVAVVSVAIGTLCFSGAGSGSSTVA